jgi:hypothetical protein
MDTLILDLAIKISTSIVDDWMGDVWFRFYLFNDEFRDYARSHVGKQLFLDKYTLVEIDGHKESHKLFNRLHRNHKDDLPALSDMFVEIWYKNGKFHRDNDKPAKISSNETVWYNNGLIHRDGDEPALIWKDYKIWYKNGNIHRDNDKPAKISIHFSVWMINGLNHRDGDKPAVVYTDCHLEWWKNGQKIKEFNPMC